MQPKYLSSVIQYFVLLMTILVCACTNEDNPNAVLNESEIFFGDETLSSISRDSLDEALYYIGTEDGNVYLYNSNDNQLDKLTSSADRIYKVVRSFVGDDTIYWVGTRNQGLWRCRRKGDELVRMEERGQYMIPAKGKETKYSAYDISVQKSGVYVASSHGLLKVPDDTCCTLRVLYPNNDIIRRDPSLLRPVVAGNIVSYDEETLVCSSDSGLLVVNTRSDDVAVKLRQQKVWNVVVRRDGVYALMGNSSVNVINLKNGQCDSFKTKYPAQIYYYEELEGINYFISDNKVQLVKDADLKKPDSYHVVPLRRAVRPKCHNLIVNNPRNRQSLLITNHTLTRIGHHQDIFNTIGPVKLACVDGNTIYYLIDERLYCQQTESDEPLTAHHIKDLSGGTKDIRFMEVQNGILYYVDSENRVFKSTLHDSYFMNSALSVLCKDKIIDPALSGVLEVTAIGKDKNNVYVGVRDGFRNVAELDKDIMLMRNDGAATPDPFITVFAQTSRDETIIGTLNDGLFIGCDNKFNQIRNTFGDAYKFTRDIAVSKNLGDSLYVLTNKCLFQPSDTTKVSGFYKLLLTDDNRLYGIKNYGIHDFNANTDYFVDIQFQPHACVALDDKVYASSSNGVFVLESSFKKNNANAAEEGFKFVTFVSHSIFNTTTITILLFLFIAGLVLIIWWLAHRTSVGSLQTSKNGLLQRMERLKNVIEYADDSAKEQFTKLKTNVENVDVKGKGKSKRELHNLNLQIMDLTTRVSSCLVVTLNEQLAVIRGIKELSEQDKDKEIQIKATLAAIQDNILERQATQIHDNDIYIKSIDALLYELSDYKALADMFIEYRREINIVIKNRNLSIHDKLNQIRTIIGVISPQAKIEISNHIDTQIEECDGKMMQVDKESQFFLSLQELKAQYVKIDLDAEVAKADIMRRLAIINRHLQIINTLWTLRDHLDNYSQMHHELKEIRKLIKKEEKKDGVSANEEKKIELNKCIQSISDDVKKEIDRFYKLLCSEKELLKELGINQKKLKDNQDKNTQEESDDQRVGKTKKQNSQYIPESLLVLRMANPDMTIARFVELLGRDSNVVYIENREIEERISQNQKIIQDYAEEHPTSFAVFLRLIK